MLTNPQSPGLSKAFYLLAVFLALIAMPSTMGILMALHPFGAWSHEEVSDPLRHLHMVSILLIVFSGIGSAFWGQEAAFRFGYRHEFRIRALAWTWGLLWPLALCVSARMGYLERWIEVPSWNALGLMLIGMWLPLSYLYVSRRKPL